jgi:hypothetical protein
MSTDRATFLFRLQCTLFCVFYAGLLLVEVVYFRHRLSFITELLGPEARLPDILTFTRYMHHPLILVLAGLAPVVLVLLAWTLRPNGFLLLGQVTLMVLLVLLVFIPPVATESTTSTILKVIHGKAKERGLTD